LHESIPYVLVGGVRFYERKEVKDVLSYLRLLLNPLDTIAQKRIETIGKRRAEKFLAFQKTPDIWKNITTLELLDKVLEVSDYLSRYDIQNEEDQARIENIKELRSVASQFPVLPQFLENVALMEPEHTPDDERANVPKDRVTLMTIHSAKGLEFSTVFIAGMEEGLFPHSRSLFDREQLEEERRLCYVGITRAKERLYLTHTRQRLFFGSRTQNMLSRFVSEIPESLLKATQEEFYD
jgi:DNA helicase-2/ATP-dependent DNA helicase PcrA